MRPPSGSDFRPPWLLTNGHIQTLLNPSALRRALLPRATRAVQKDARTVILNAGQGVRLSGAFTAQKLRRQPRGLAVLFHGWEGSADSIYTLQTGSRLLREGWDVFRLNFRDHGHSQDLNEELFHSCRLDEIVNALGVIAARWPTRLMALAGFSLGGNFALRVAIRHARAHTDIPLHYVLAVCPIIDPAAGLLEIERAAHGLYHAYFMHSWRKSLRAKQMVFPQHFYFRPGELKYGLHDLTETLVLRHTGFTSLQDYLNSYSLVGNAMQAIKIPTTILTARDDPMIPVTSFEQLDLPPQVELDIAPHGGHCGFIRSFNMRSFTDDYIAARFNAVADGMQPVRPGT